MTTLGFRLREERDRRGLNQTDFAALANGSRGAQAAYERDEKIPGGGYLMALAASGIDVLYVLTGQRIPKTGALSDDEQELIEIYRNAPLAIKAAALAALTAGSSASNSIQVSGNSNRVAGRDFNEKNK
ncbi:helix-turn-helix domain-containing protein [Cedecea sp. P7760]|jgi:transcriptional regulator with XRE-family HTH domain|uniref:helix-turn-helix domain-containing protein n=1 Tax=Cedecea sp. P7760 TaxID=2726983 RepID=UPI0015A11F91|nr:XRE family transcriptional regulator [Cedecea sp. P7760]NWC62928.1 XRE family transcriptional regulator [Cedecea sp. P7760]